LANRLSDAAITQRKYTVPRAVPDLCHSIGHIPILPDRHVPGRCAAPPQSNGVHVTDEKTLADQLATTATGGQ
jgi:hypothetical protein